MNLDDFHIGFDSWKNEMIPMLQAGLDLLILQRSESNGLNILFDAKRMLCDDFSEICHKLILQQASLSDDVVRIYMFIQDILYPHMNFLTLEEHRVALRAIGSTLTRTNSLYDISPVRSLAALHAVDMECDGDVNFGFGILLKAFVSMLSRELASVVEPLSSSLTDSYLEKLHGLIGISKT